MTDTDTAATATGGAGAMDDEVFARLRRQARRIMGLVRCVACAKLLQVEGDTDGAAALEGLRDEGWTPAGDGWRCDACGEDHATRPA